MTKIQHIYRLARVGLRQLKRKYYHDVENILKYIIDLIRGEKNG